MRAQDPERNSAVLKLAAEGVLSHRQGEATVKLVSPDGRPIGGALVEVAQQTHDFPFGCIVRPRHYRDKRYLSKFKELFNFVELLEFNWGQYEPDEGRPLREERRRFIYEWCIPNGITRFYGHMLVWTRQYGKYPKTNLPLWLFRYDRARQYELLKRRIQRELRDYSDVNIIWDVVNEPVHCRVWGDWTKPDTVDEPLEKVLPYVLDALRWAHEANPKAPLLVNEYCVIVRGKYRDRFWGLLEMLLERGAPLSAVGIQAHEPFKGTYWFSPAEIWEACEMFGTQLGLPIYFTELWYVSDPSQRIRGEHRSGCWNPDKQAEAIEEFYRIAFGHPKVAGIVYFGLSDRDVVRPTIGLLDEAYRPKPAWRRLKYLLRKEWWTRCSGRTSSDGTFRFRGFFGLYRIKARYGGRVFSWKRHLEKGKEAHWLLVLR